MNVKNVLIFLIFFTYILSAKPLPLFFEGNEHLDDRTLYSAVGLYKPYFYEFWKDEPAVDPKTLKILTTTIKNFYRMNGYFHSKISYHEANKTITITVQENPPIIVDNISTISEQNINAEIPFKIGDVFNAQAFTDSKNAIKLHYADFGYCNTDLNAKSWVDIETNYAYLMYEVTPNKLCYFGAVTITTPQSIEPRVINSFLNFTKGDLYSPDRIRQSYDNLYAQEGIAKAIIDTSEKNLSIVPINITVSEYSDLRRFSAGGGYSSDEGMTLLAGIKYRNFFGNLKTVSLDTRYTEIKQTVKANFNMPLSNRNTFGIDAALENERFDGFKERHLYETLYLKQNRIPHSYQESILFDHIRTYDSSNFLTFPNGTLFIISPKMQWNYDIRDKILNPSHGHFLQTEVTGSIHSDISDASYYKFFISGGYIYPLETSVAALRVNVGSLRVYEGRIPASYRFYAGGMNSNRAYSYRQLGPKDSNGNPTGSDSILESTLEYRFPIYEKFRGVLFNDTTFIGNSYYPDYDKGTYSFGAGLRYLTPIGPLSIDFGFDIANPSEEFALHFHVGELF